MFPSVNKSSERIVKWPAKPLRSSLGSEINFCYLSLLLCSSAPLFSPVLTDSSCLSFCLPNEAFACHVNIFFILQNYQSNVMSKRWVTFIGEKMYTDPLTQKNYKLHVLLSWHCMLYAAWQASMELKKN